MIIYKYHRMEEKEMKEYKVITALFLSAVMLGTAPLTV